MAKKKIPDVKRVESRVKAVERDVRLIKRTLGIKGLGSREPGFCPSCWKKEKETAGVVDKEQEFARRKYIYFHCPEDSTTWFDDFEKET